MNTLYTSPDLHMHSVYSDGTDTPEQLLDNVRKAGLDVFSLTDHDTFSGCLAMQRCLMPDDPYFIAGVELSCEDAAGKYHVLGYAYDIAKPSIVKAIDYTHNTRIQKMQDRIAFMKATYGYDFDKSEIKAIMALNNPGKPHLAQLMIAKGYVADKKQAFDQMAAFHGEDKPLSPEEAVDAILESDGIPVLAHGILADGTKNLSIEQIEDRVKRLKDVGLMGLECYYSTYTEEQKNIMLSLAEKYNLLVTAGSDYHGTNKTVRLGQTNNPDFDKMKRFYSMVKLLLED